MKRAQFIIFIGSVLAILFLSHFIVYEVAVQLFGFSGLGLTWLRIILIILALSFVPAQVLTVWFYNLWTKIFYRVSVIWLGFLMYLFLAACVYAIVLGLSSLSGAGWNFKEFGIGLFLFAVLVGIYALIHARDICVKKLRINLPNLPAEWVGKKILFVSDLHLGQIYGRKFAAKVRDRINALNPELVLIGGDLYDGGRVDKPAIISPLSGITAPRGIYFITGNHDGFSEKDTIQDIAAITQADIKVLRDQFVDLDGLQVVGVDYRHTIKMDAYETVLKQLAIDTSRPSILLRHVPVFTEIAERRGISLQLSGHTHRGQVWPVSLIPNLVYKQFAYGLKSQGSMRVYTSSGVGTWGPPFRVGTDSELVLIELG
ncbi:MAG TPA: metallophosphoesterase [Patescibacteria group bacterium]|nr:metallophosphoesterase [Patescibacteria group bacterium]